MVQHLVQPQEGLLLLQAFGLLQRCRLLGWRRLCWRSDRAPLPCAPRRAPCVAVRAGAGASTSGCAGRGPGRGLSRWREVREPWRFALGALCERRFPRHQRSVCLRRGPGHQRSLRHQWCFRRTRLHERWLLSQQLPLRWQLPFWWQLPLRWWLPLRRWLHVWRRLQQWRGFISHLDWTGNRVH